MRPQVLTTCILAAALCVLLARHRAPPNIAITVASVPASAVPEHPDYPVAPEAASPSATAQFQAPEWEPCFLEIASEPEYLQSQEALEELAAELNDDQIRDALTMLAREQSSAALVFGRALAQRWAEKSPGEIARWSTTLPDNNFAHTVFKEVATAWAAQDFVAATQWVQQMPDGGNKAAAELSLALAAANGRQGAAAVKLLFGLALESGRDDLLNYSFRQWAITDRDDAVAGLSQIPDPILRQHALAAIATDITDPFTAATFTAVNLSPGTSSDQVVAGIIQSWAASAPNEAAAWVTQFPHGPLRDTVAKTLLEVWGKEDPAAANAWAQAVTAQ